MSTIPPPELSPLYAAAAALFAEQIHEQFEKDLRNAAFGLATTQDQTDAAIAAIRPYATLTKQGFDLALPGHRVINCVRGSIGLDFDEGGVRYTRLSEALFWAKRLYVPEQGSLTGRIGGNVGGEPWHGVTRYWFRNPFRSGWVMDLSTREVRWMSEVDPMQEVHARVNERLAKPKKVQSLKLAEDRMAQVAAGAKACTIRQGRRDVALGAMTLEATNGGHPDLKVEVTSVTYCRFASVSWPDAAKFNYPSLAAFRQTVLSIYPDLTDDSEITVIWFAPPTQP